jgi:hypothetical protein
MGVRMGTEGQRWVLEGADTSVWMGGAGGERSKGRRGGGQRRGLRYSFAS